MRRILILLSFAIVSLLSACSKTDNDITIREMIFGDSDPLLAQYKNYSFYPSNKRQSVLWEPFDNNHRNWPVDTTGYNDYRKITNGVYHLAKTNGSSNTNSTSNTLPLLDVNRDYEIEIRVKIVRFYFSLIEQYSYQFSFTKAGSIVSISGNSGDTEPNFFLFPTNTKVRIKYNSPNGYDTFTLRKVNNKWILFVNGEYITHVESSDIGTKYFSFSTSTNEALLDYIKYDYLLN